MFLYQFLTAPQLYFVFVTLKVIKFLLKDFGRG